jgi:hypothetical protein
MCDLIENDPSKHTLWGCRYFNSSGGNCPGCSKNVGVSAARFGDMKIILGISECSGSTVVAWPEPTVDPVPFGKTTGWVRDGTNWAYSGLLAGVNGHEGGHGDPQCSTGLADKSTNGGEVCCLKSCTQCGCPGGKPFGPGGKDGCCVSAIAESKKMCTDYPPPCIMKEQGLPGCLFNVSAGGLSVWACLQTKRQHNANLMSH